MVKEETKDTKKFSKKISGVPENQRFSKHNKKYYICEECDFAYESKEIAEKCQNWCKEHHSCNIEITRYAVKID